MRHLDVTSGKYVELTAMRAKLLKAARDWFDANSFTEVPCPHITGATGSCEWFPHAMPVPMSAVEGDEALVKFFVNEPWPSVRNKSPLSRVRSCSVISTSLQ